MPWHPTSVRVQVTHREESVEMEQAQSFFPPANFTWHLPGLSILAIRGHNVSYRESTQYQGIQIGRQGSAYRQSHDLKIREGHC